VDKARKNQNGEVLVDPVHAYDLISPQFPRLAEQRRPYLAAIDELIAQRLPQKCQSLLDVGAGDGGRATRIARRANIEHVVLLEPSREMARRSLEPRETWTIRAEELDESDAEFNSHRFDVIICLWNVLGHIRPARARQEVLRQLASRLSASGKLFVDVNHRYNARAYGRSRTLLRLLQDFVRPSEHNGDVTTRWTFGDLRCATYGHLFTEKEMREMALGAGLKVEEQIAVDYDSGETTRSTFQGNLLYVLTL
jgi:2-polyprenyl-3-methyl-5-hydroxy-6-metoxy-1,4-benzoquinol methylase